MRERISPGTRSEPHQIILTSSKLLYNKNTIIKNVAYGRTKMNM